LREDADVEVAGRHVFLAVHVSTLIGGGVLFHAPHQIAHFPEGQRHGGAMFLQILEGRRDVYLLHCRWIDYTTSRTAHKHSIPVKSVALCADSTAIAGFA
jgi:hypothetical protein